MVEEAARQNDLRGSRMRMKSMLAAVAAMAALSAAPAFAETVNSGYVGLSAATFDVEDEDFQEYALEGAVAFPISGNFGVQLDAGIGTIDGDNIDSEDTLTGTAHVFHRTANRLIGAFVGASDVDDVTVYGGGAEADFYVNDWTLGGRVTYLTDDSDVDSDTWAAEARAKYFYTDNAMVSGAIGYTDTSIDVAGVDDFSSVYVGVGGEYLLNTAPVSFFGGVNYTDVEDGDGVTGVQIGVRLNWNTGSLRDRDRSGASLQGIGSNLAGVF
jgi:hypothetical protein